MGVGGGGSLFLTCGFFSFPSLSFSSTLTRPGLLQSFGCVLPGSSSTLTRPRLLTASAMSRASGEATASSLPTRRPSARVREASK